MNDILRALILGIVQGLTEFLPVSSSGHLELGKYFLGDDAIAEESLLMTVVLHFGTALSTVFVFRKDIIDIITKFFTKGHDQEKQFVWKIIFSMVPAVAIGLLLEKQMEALFDKNVVLVFFMLIVTGLLLFWADTAKANHKDVSFSYAVKIGIAQAIAILPGISRSGATISTSVLLGIDRTKAARFSFLMVIPLIFGKMAKDIISGDLETSSISLTELLVGFLAAFVVGIVACKWMIKIVQNAKLKFFAYYCFAVGFVGLIYVYVK